jgi:uncharacterized membrane protein
MLVEAIEVIVVAIELVAVAILAIGVAWVLGRGGLDRVRRRPWTAVYEDIRQGLGRVLLLGLEVLIAADIVATIALDLSIPNVAALGLIVLIRTFLSWAIEVETDGYWPWNTAARRAAAESNAESTTNTGAGSAQS